MEYTPVLGHGLPYDPFKSLTVPRPIGWLSTISSDGVVNLAPYSQWQNLTWDPPMVMLAANQSVHGGRKDTVRNAEDTAGLSGTWQPGNCAKPSRSRPERFPREQTSSS